MMRPHATLVPGKAAVLIALLLGLLAEVTRAKEIIPIRDTGPAELSTVPAEAVNLLGIARGGANISVTFQAVQGETYRLERKLKITEPVWQNIPGLADLTATANGATSITDVGAVALGQAFYRVNFLPTLTVAKTGTGAGTLTSSPTGINCGTDCAESFFSGTQVTLTSAPSPGSAFTNWGGACAGAGSNCVVTMDVSKSVSANYVLLNSNPACGTNVFLGSVSGDTASASLMTNGLGEKWVRARIAENNSGITTVNLTGTITLVSPPGMDYDLYVYCLSCGGTLAGSSASSGTDVVEVRRNDTLGTDESFDVLIEVRFSNGNSPANWNLTIAGNTGATMPTCP